MTSRKIRKLQEKIAIVEKGLLDTINLVGKQTEFLASLRETNEKLTAQIEDIKTRVPIATAATTPPELAGYW